MEASSQRKVGGGLWNNPKATQYSKETQDMLRLMVQESRLNNLQTNKINKCLQNGASLPLTSDPTWSTSPSQPKSYISVKTSFPGKPQRRMAEACRSGNSYAREKFRPGPTRDLEKEKKRLQDIFAAEEPKAALTQKVPAYENPEEIDRYQEVLDEINERRQFLEDMTSLGKEKQYINIISTEISQKIRELEVLEKAQSTEKDAMNSERKENAAE
ncbi:UPF0193 protein EVG1 [Cheilinus undulatus]|uniref:UPF0193 protein EVG1 n=1 Tax=Cheilinus undulatus TaxID=241271 RepID=UPI001BD6C7BA|nr:UPF0193 protein EVG1 [Cheilinus undulatus]